MLIERSPEVDVEELHSVADTQERQVALERYTNEIELETVAPVADAGRLGVPLAAVPLGIDVAAPRQQQSDGAVEHGGVIVVDARNGVEVGRNLLVREELKGRDHARPAPGTAHCVYVRERETAVILTQLTDDCNEAVAVRVRENVDLRSLPDHNR